MLQDLPRKEVGVSDLDTLDHVTDDQFKDLQRKSAKKKEMKPLLNQRMIGNQKKPQKSNFKVVKKMKQMILLALTSN